MGFLKLAGRMTLLKKTISSALIIIILSSVLVIGNASGEHVDPEESEEDLASLYETLNITAGKLERPLDEALSVNYTFYEDQNGDLSNRYDEEALNNSKDLSMEIEKELSKPESVYQDIKGEIGSSEFLEEYFVPLYSTSKNLTLYSEKHSYMVTNLSAMVLEDEDSEISPVEAFNNTHDHLNAMQKHLDKMEENIQKIDRENVDLSGLERSIQDNGLLLIEYREYLEDIGHELDLPPSLFIYGPDTTHPGESFEIEVNYFDGDEFNTTADVSLLLNGGRSEVEPDIVDDGYIFRYEIGWGLRLFSELKFSARLDETDLTSEELIVQIIPYSSNIDLEIEKEAYYDENITIDGLFETDADIDLTDIELYAPDREISPDENGSFDITYDSKRFRWGTSVIEVVFEGTENDTISSTHENVSFEVSIPTDIVILEYTAEVEHDSANNFTLKGRLINISKEEDGYTNGIGSQELDVYLNGDQIGKIETDDEGFFNFSLSSDEGLEVGTNVLGFSFDGSERYRSAELTEIRFEVVEEEFWMDTFIIGGLTTLMIIIIASIFLFSKKEEEPVEEITKTGESKPTQEISIPSISERHEITKAYGRFLDMMQRWDLIEVQEGKTHREIEKEMTSHPTFSDFRKELSHVTSLFEKALFTERDIHESEIKEFNSSVSKLIRRITS